MSRLVLVADDDDLVRELIAAGLKGSGCQAVEVADGGELLTRLSGPTPDLILLDLDMPVLGGLEVLRRLRAAGAWPDVPVLFLTASEATHHMVEARRLGARGYLTKPIRLPALLDRVARVLDDPDLRWLDDMTAASSG